MWQYVNTSDAVLRFLERVPEGFLVVTTVMDYNDFWDQAKENTKRDLQVPSPVTPAASAAFFFSSQGR